MKHAQRGATLIVGLIMLVLITFVVVNAFNLSSSNLKAVGNTQDRNESLAAANRSIEEMISTPEVFKVLAPNGYSYTVDLNNGDTTTKREYAVKIAQPRCVRALIDAVAPPSEVEIKLTGTTGTTWDVDFEVKASVKDNLSGSDVEVRQGFRVRLSDSDKVTMCG